MSEQATVRFTMSLPEGLLAEMDAMMAEQGQRSRSKFVRDLVRSRLVASRWQGGGEDVVGVLTLSYDHHQRGLQDALNHVQHRRYVNVLCSTHVHLDGHNCLEVIVVKGASREVQRIADRLISTRGVKHGKLICTTTGEALA